MASGEDGANGETEPAWTSGADDPDTDFGAGLGAAAGDGEDGGRILISFAGETDERAESVPVPPRLDFRGFRDFLDDIDFSAASARVGMPVTEGAGADRSGSG